MRIAIPVHDGRLCAHFGHCSAFALLDIDPETKQIVRSSSVNPPPHQPGVLPRWLKDEGAEVVIAGGMGNRAMALFAQAGIQVLTGAPEQTPDELALAYAEGTLEQGANVCDH